MGRRGPGAAAILRVTPPFRLPRPETIGDKPQESGRDNHFRGSRKSGGNFRGIQAKEQQRNPLQQQEALMRKLLSMLLPLAAMAATAIPTDPARAATTPCPRAADVAPAQKAGMKPALVEIRKLEAL
jgi:hypothetical protein